MFWWQVTCALSAAAIAVIFAIWATNIFFPPPPNQPVAYEIEYDGWELDRARQESVNLAEVQRQWPFAMGDMRERERLFNKREQLKNDPSQLTHVAFVESGAVAATPRAAPKPDIPLPNLLAEADLARGEKVAAKCVTCHSFNKGGRNDTGPNLWNIVGGASAQVAGFKYSDALIAFGGPWDYDALDQYLKRPANFIKGNRMGFAGLRKAEDRANLIAYMRTMGENPPPLPAVVELPAEEPAQEPVDDAPVEGAPTDAPAEDAAAEDDVATIE